MFPSIFFFFKLQVPFHDDDKLRDWMYKVYKEKDDMLGTNFILVILAIVPDWFKGRTVMLLISFVHEGKVFSVIKTIGSDEEMS